MDDASYENSRIIESEKTNAFRGIVKWSPVKSLWFTSMALAWFIGGSLYFSWGAVAAFFLCSGITLCFGHSLGMHRKLIHNSFDCPTLIEKFGVWLGTLVGLGGPFTMMFTHDMRDWAQRQTRCHPFFSHQSSFLKDGWWQLHCKLHLDNPPEFKFPSTLISSKYYRFIQSTSMLQQVPLAAVLYICGGWGFVFWGICGRVTVSIFGHWFIGYFAHNKGHRAWHINGAAVQGHNIKFCGIITFGECWHNNHHAFPGSAKLGLERDQTDPGWWVLIGAEKLGVVRNIKLPESLPARSELTPYKSQ